MSLQNPQFEEVYPFIRSMAVTIVNRKRTHYWLEVDDVVSMSYPPFLEACKAWECDSKDKTWGDFHDFLSVIIKRRMIDQTRSLTWASKGEMHKQKAALKKDPTTPKFVKYQYTYNSLVPGHSTNDDVDDIIENHLHAQDSIKKEFNKISNSLPAFKELLKILPISHRERDFLYRYYGLGITAEEIGKLWSVSESRICQVKATLLARLKTLTCLKEENKFLNNEQGSLTPSSG
jgi:RNA polymerase sigma factor (sigma-70 family)